MSILSTALSTCSPENRKTLKLLPRADFRWPFWFAVSPRAGGRGPPPKSVLCGRPAPPPAAPSPPPSAAAPPPPALPRGGWSGDVSHGAVANAHARFNRCECDVNATRERVSTAAGAT
eukprot:1180967-Prorocentrum_minimum.AAC.1